MDEKQPMLTRYTLMFTTFLSLSLSLIVGGMVAVRQSQPRGGNELAFTAYRSDNRNLYITDIERNLVTQLTAQQSVGCASYASDGNRIAYWVGETGIYLMDSDGRNPQLWLDLPYPYYVDMDWSPDGAYFAFVAGVTSERSYFQLHVYDMNQSEPLLLIEDERPFTYRWSGDAQHLLYTVYDAESEGYLAYLFDVTTQTRERIPQVVINSYQVEYDWSQANDRLVFQHNSDFYIADRNGGNRYQITYSPDEYEILPSWSPDGNLLVYITHEFEIQIFDTYDYTTPKFTIPGPGIPVPEVWSLFYWSPNGKWLLWQLGSDILLVDVNTGIYSWYSWLESPIGRIACPAWRP